MEYVCIFGASSNSVDAAYIEEAERTGRAIARSGRGLVFGAGAHGLMGAAARGVKAEGGRVVGVIPEKLNVPGIAFADCDELIVTATMHERKATMEELACAFIALPGGLGTFEELLEALTLKQLGYFNKPIAVVNGSGYYTKLLEQIDRAVDDGFTLAAHREVFRAVANGREAVEYIDSYVPAELPDKIRGVLDNAG